MRLEILVTMTIFFGGSLLTGYGIRRLIQFRQEEGMLFSVVSGVMAWWALMEAVLVPMTMKHAAFQTFSRVYSGLVLLSAAFGLCCYREILRDVRKFFGEARQYLTLGHLAALALMLWQLYFLHHHMYLEWDDTYYVNLANEAIRSNQIYWVYPETGSFVDFDKRYVLSLWPVFYAWLSGFTGVAPTIMAHTILPWVMIPLAYMVYGLIGRQLFEEDREMQGMFLALVVMLHLFMSGEHTAGLTFLSITPWVGKGVLATVLIPMLFYGVLRAVKREICQEWILLGITCLAGCLLSSMGIMLTPVFVGVAVFLTAVQKKSVKCLLGGIGACAPCLVLGVYYIYLTH